MRIAFVGRWLRFELELGAPDLRPRKYQVLPRKIRFRVQEELWRGVAARLSQRTDTNRTN